MGLISVQMSINPFELYWLVAVCFVGVSYLVNGLPTPNSVNALLPPLAVKLWSANLGIGGLAALVGGLWQANLERGLAAYQFGWALMGVGCLVYGAGVLVVLPSTGMGVAVPNIMWGLACLTRVVQVQRFFAIAANLAIDDTALRDVPVLMPLKIPPEKS